MDFDGIFISFKFEIESDEGKCAKFSSEEDFRLTRLSGIFGVWVDFDQQCVFLAEQVVEVEEHLDGAIEMVIEADGLGDLQGLLLGETFVDVNWLVDDCLGVLGGNLLDVDSTLR
jgi:hypothetical protein